MTRTESIRRYFSRGKRAWYSLQTLLGWDEKLDPRSLGNKLGMSRVAIYRFKNRYGLRFTINGRIR